MLKQIKQLYAKPTAHCLALTELEDSKRRLLQQQAAAEYHAKLTEYYKLKINRLNTFVNDAR